MAISSNLASMLAGPLNPGGTTAGGTGTGVGSNKIAKTIVIFDGEEKDVILKPRRGSPLHSSEGSTK